MISNSQTTKVLSIYIFKNQMFSDWYYRFNFLFTSIQDDYKICPSSGRFRNDKKHLSGSAIRYHDA
jgi:hypothetical protein